MRSTEYLPKCFPGMQLCERRVAKKWLAVMAIMAQLLRTTYLEGMSNPARIKVVTINLYICSQRREGICGCWFNVQQQKTFLIHFCSIRNEHSEAYRMKNKSDSDVLSSVLQHQAWFHGSWKNSWWHHSSLLLYVQYRLRTRLIVSNLKACYAFTFLRFPFQAMFLKPHVRPYVLDIGSFVLIGIEI